MIKIENERLEISGNLLDIITDITYAVADFSQKTQNIPLPMSKEATDRFERSVLRALIIGRCKDMDKACQILDDKTIKKTFNVSIKEVQKSLELIRDLLNKEISGGTENDKG